MCFTVYWNDRETSTDTIDVFMSEEESKILDTSETQIFPQRQQQFISAGNNELTFPSS